MYTPDLRENSLKLNPSTLQIAGVKNLSFVVCRGAEHANLFAGRSHMLMYDKTCGEDR